MSANVDIIETFLTHHCRLIYFSQN